MTALQELKDYLAQQNLSAKYTDTTGKSIFPMLTTVEGIDKQNSFDRFIYDAKWWIDYNQTNDEFELKVGYFTKEGDAVSREDFISEMNKIMPDRKVPARDYGEDSKVTWTKVASGYAVNLPEVPVFIFPITMIVEK